MSDNVRSKLPTAAAAGMRDRLANSAGASRGGGAVAGARDRELRGERSGAASGGKGDNRPRISEPRTPTAEVTGRSGEGSISPGTAQDRERFPGVEIPPKEITGRSGEGRVSPGDGSNRPRLRMPGERDTGPDWY
jgi:hypothetical protein